MPFPAEPRVSLSGPLRSLEHLFEACEVDKPARVLASSLFSGPNTWEGAEE